MTLSDQTHCADCGRELPKRRYRAGAGYRCGACYKRPTRPTAAWAERDREASRRWKRINLGQPGLPR